MDQYWKPILTDDRQSAVLQLLDTIGGCIRARIGNPQRAEGVGTMPCDLTLASGLAGDALFHCYHYLQTGDARALQCCNDTLLAAAQAAGEGMQRSSLYGGLAGAGWAIDHVCARLGRERVPAFEDLLGFSAEISDFLARFIRIEAEPRDYDLINGLVGFGVFYLGRLQATGACENLEYIVKALSTAAILEPEGVTWRTDARLLPSWQAAVHPNGYFNIGLAHGVPGIIAFLSRVHAAGVLQDETARLIRQSIGWMRAYRLADHEESMFGTAISADHATDEPSRLAWCYGDAGIAASFLSAAAALGDERLHALALMVADKAAARDAANAGVVDGSLCHGAFGLAHIFNRLYQHTGTDTYRERALYWFDNGLSMRDSAGPGTGYLFYDMDYKGTMDWRPSAGLLMGDGGTGLALMAGMSDCTPAWDQAFLLDVGGIG